jgi:hypothetical protein
MKLRHDLTHYEHVPFETTPWTPSPEPSVTRKLLERDGEEIARATSIVRYAARSSFPEHTHERGEEFIVLDGVFSDEFGNYPTSSYVRNPPGSKHRPFSTDGCVIFVKLRQFQPLDTGRVVIALEHARSKFTLLHSFGSECVSLVRLDAGEGLELDARARGVELFVLEGSVNFGAAECGVWTWLRAPRATEPLLSTSGGVCWVKQGHLP